ncbi:hypothetical protein Syun_022284 [Stephania yunnanensis]|uniref:DNA replication factor Cdt1 C-terminal domain-containing protein n=1 Tax=Stephania yunnanensis TaxID=152371 RepID=A0AAP0HYE5_9MAGN
MERGKCEDGTQKVADERDCRMPSDLKSNASYLTYEQSSGDVENEDSVDNFASSTPLKTMQQSTRCKKTGFTSPAGVVKQLSKDFVDEGVIAEDVETEVPKKITDNFREGHVDEQEWNPSIPVTRHLSPQFELSDSDTLNFLKDVGGIEASALKNEELVIPSSLSQSIRRRFSQKQIILEEEKTQLIAVPVPSLPANDGADANQNTMNLQQESHGLVLETTSMRSPVELIFGEQCHSAAACESSPPKPFEVSHKLMSETPAQQTPPKRSLACLSDKISSEVDTTSQATAKRSLSFSFLQDDSSTSCATIDKSKQRDNEGLPSSENIFTEDSIISFSGISQMVEENQKPKKSTLQKHCQIASLDGLFSLTINIFKSVNRSLITKQELLQKIISDNLDIVDEREAEEQLALLEELIPDWICRKTISSGDTMYSAPFGQFAQFGKTSSSSSPLAQ